MVNDLHEHRFPSVVSVTSMSLFHFQNAFSFLSFPFLSLSPFCTSVFAMSLSWGGTHSLLFLVVLSMPDLIPI